MELSSTMVLEELLGVLEQSPSLILEKVVERPANNQKNRGILRSGRVSKKSDFFIYDGSIYNTKSNHEDDNPLTYEGAMEDFNSKIWKQAMDAEMNSMKSNMMWELIDLPVMIKPIGCNWIFKKKRNAEGKMETHKARLVRKGYTQKEGIDYNGTFSLVAMLKSIHILLSIIAALDYEIWQMYVKLAFLNGYLDETIYMAQPTGYVVKRKEQKSIKDKNVLFLIFYVDNILLIGNNMRELSSVKLWLGQKFSMRDLGEASYNFGI
ncbi:Retrovirus-related Pol polyprotein from transposon TNT 1-94 [Gossypium australe]|uniref:Retrovirus-related Pol polyprotein from transposon TNT 1-94 n=1 Tax=Gossypium australe TaxID=47621 RepID=A0A5B6V540_9ROSI|nr:Retrovirus-related Pol polyprotein from transposon TNT 1-94 [Gossypium australe]